MTLTLNELSKRTDVVVDAVTEASRFAGRDIWMNGYGILADPSSVRANLAEARKHIDAALKALNETQWPRDADYDALEAAHNRQHDEEHT